MQKRIIAVLLFCGLLWLCHSPESENKMTRLQVQGQVTDSTDGAPIYQVAVSLESGRGLELVRTTTDPDGRYSLSSEVSEDNCKGAKVLAFHLDFDPQVKSLICTNELQTINFRLDRFQ